eukprot:Awhi_evm2s891
MLFSVFSLECVSDKLCVQSSDVCDGQNSNYLNCNKCNTGYNVVNSECKECLPQSRCTQSLTECSSENENYLKCLTCDIGLFPEPSSGICGACGKNNPHCITYDVSCVVDTADLACNDCDNESELINGVCGKLNQFC